jgi:3D (Asp-Asp-Asp) domain-containing protein
VLPLNSRWPTLCAAVVVGVLLTASGPTADAAKASPKPAGAAGALRRSEAAAVLQLYAAESALARARAELERLDARSAALTRAERDASLRTEIVRRSLEESRTRVATLVRELYVQGETDAIAVILGASSLDEVMAGIEGLSRATALNERLAAQARQRAGELERLRDDLAARRGKLDAARDEARIGATHLARAVALQRDTIAALRRRQSLTTRRLAALQARAAAAEQKSALITRESAKPAATTAAATPEAAAATTVAATATGPRSGTRSLVVDAVAYHLPGNTASGLPVGVGVIAVDPTVIPLGTRLLVPGYGPAVAADVGSGVKGNLIDLWMPSTAQARAWGRRTVTITIYG